MERNAVAVTHHLLVIQEVLVWCDGVDDALRGWVRGWDPPHTDTGVAILTLRLCGTLVLHYTPPTQRVAISNTAGAVCVRGALLKGNLHNLTR